MKVAVVGGGAAGLCAARKCLERCLDVTLFEASTRVGGTWVYRSDTNTYSSMYKGLRTNLPKEIMRFSDVEFPSSLPSFVTSDDVARYLDKYAEPVKKLVKFGCEVREVTREGTHWKVIYYEDNQPHCELFDVLFVCNGHFTKPFIPSIQGQFTGPISHSHNYRTCDQYRGKTVAVVGAGPSGIDIALQLADVAKKVYLLSDKDRWGGVLPSNVEQRRGLVRFKDSTLVLTDDTSVDTESVLMCTGYVYDMPMLKDLITLKYKHKMVSPTYLHVTHALYPSSLFFIGLNSSVLPFPLFECQVQLAIAMLSNQADTTCERILNWEQERLKHLQAHGVSGSQFHVLAASQWDYLDEMCRVACCPNPIPPLTRAIYTDTSSRRRTDVVNYKHVDYILTPNSFTLRSNQ